MKFDCRFTRENWQNDRSIYTWYYNGNKDPKHSKPKTQKSEKKKNIQMKQIRSGIGPLKQFDPVLFFLFLNLIFCTYIMMVQTELQEIIWDIMTHDNVEWFESQDRSICSSTNSMLSFRSNAHCAQGCGDLGPSEPALIMLVAGESFIIIEWFRRYAKSRGNLIFPLS